MKLEVSKLFVAASISSKEKVRYDGIPSAPSFIVGDMYPFVKEKKKV